jgi:hypothetical protein
MPFANIPLTKDDLNRSQWQDVIAGCPKKECSSYWHPFMAKADEAGSSGDNVLREAHTLLGAATSMMLKLDSKTDPFAPIMVFRTGRSAILDDISDAHVEVLREWLPDIGDPELRARIADIVWMRKRDYRAAQTAIDAYLESAKTLEHPEHWPATVERTERALQLAVSLGRKSGHFAKIVAHIESVLDKYQGEDPLFLSARMMELLQRYEQGDPVKYAALAEKAAMIAESQHEWHRARQLWDIKAKWHKLGKDPDSARASALKSAETYIQEAEDAKQRDGSGYLVASAFLQQAIEALRRIEGTTPRVESLHRTLLDYGQKSLAEMKTFSSSIDISKSVEEAQQRVKGKTIREALFALAFLVSPPDVKQLHAQSEKMVAETPLQHLFAAAIVNSSGKVIGRKPSAVSNDPAEIEEAMQAEMFGNALRFQGVYAQALIDPARHQINREHNVRLNDVLPIVVNNPFVPSGREEIFLHGLYAGLTGDLLTAGHFLIPQVENSIRYVLSQQGVITSGLDSQGVQEEYGLETLLKMPETQAIFGEDLVFDLRGLLIERYGTNLRNRLAHGLMDSAEIVSLSVLYLWWLVLRLCCIPLVAQVQQDESEKPAESAESSDHIPEA